MTASPQPPAIPSLQDLLRQRMPRTHLTVLLIGLNLLVFVATLASGAGFWHSPNNVQLAWGANFGPATQNGEWWRLGTAMFLHFGALHLGINMWALWDSGQFVERMYGRGRFLLIYFMSGLGGNLLSLVSQHGKAVSGGASGAIFGVFGALLICLWSERRRLHPTEFRWLFWGAAGFSVATIAFGQLIPGIDNAAHIGGFACGTLAGIALGRPLLKGRGETPFSVRLIALASLLIASHALLTRIPPPAYRWADEEAARKEIDAFIKEEAKIEKAWKEIVSQSQRAGTSFETLAGRVDADIGNHYQESFEQLSKLPDNPSLPSSSTLAKLKQYAEERSAASRKLAEELRKQQPAAKRHTEERAP